jgi:hypothetical protein
MSTYYDVDAILTDALVSLKALVFLTPPPLISLSPLSDPGISTVA